MTKCCCNSIFGNYWRGREYKFHLDIERTPAIIAAIIGDGKSRGCGIARSYCKDVRIAYRAIRPHHARPAIHQRELAELQLGIGGYGKFWPCGLSAGRNGDV